MTYKINASHNVGNHRAQRHGTSKSICIILMLIWFAGESASEAAVRQKRGMADSFSDGLKYAGQMFGINTAADVANLVAKAFSNVATSPSNFNLLSSAFQQRPEYSAGSQESDESASSHEQQKQATQDTHRHGVPPAKETVGVDFSSAKLITGVLRMIGFDARKLGALAINAIVMIAQAIGSTLMGTFSKKNVGVTTVDGGRLFMQQQQQQQQSQTDSSFEHEQMQPHDEHAENQPRSLRDGTPIDWFLENPSKEMQQLLARATNVKLTDELTNMIVEAETKSTEGENSAACLKMFVCKSSPFIWGMQKSLKKRLNAGRANTKGADAIKENAADEAAENEAFMNASIFYRDLPSLDEFREYGDICKQRYEAHCKSSVA